MHKICKQIRDQSTIDHELRNGAQESLNYKMSNCIMGNFEAEIIVKPMIN